MIAKYGLEYYQEKLLNRNKYLYASNKDNRDYHINKSRSYYKEHKHLRKHYVKGGQVELVENYELAKADNFEGWDLHHRLEIHEDYHNTMEELILMNLYYDRPPEELIFLRKGEHSRLHRINKC